MFQENMSMRENNNCQSAFYTGDGCISLEKHKEKILGMSITIKQTDIRPLENFQKFFDCGNITGPYVSKNPNVNPIWRYKCSKISDVLNVIHLMWDNLPYFRKKQAYNVIMEYYSSEKRKIVPDFTKYKWNSFNVDITNEFFEIDRTFREKCAWCAGIYNSEGSTSFHKGPVVVGSVRCGISQVDPDPINFFVDCFEKFDRNIQIRMESKNLKNINHRDCHKLDVNSIEAVKYIIDSMWFALSEPKREQYNKVVDLYLESVKNSTACKFKTKCKFGHEFTDENTRIYDGKRVCKQCSRDKVKKHSEKLKNNPDRNIQQEILEYISKHNICKNNHVLTLENVRMSGISARCKDCDKMQREKLKN